MMQWLMNHLATIIGTMIIVVVFAAILYHEIKKRKHGGGGCSCGCGGCANQEICMSHTYEESSHAQPIHHK